MRLTTVASLLFVLNDGTCVIVVLDSISVVFVLVIGDCPSIYRMMDPDHSYCAEKVSVLSLPSTSADIKLILDMHNEERSNVASKYMQKMVSFVKILNRPIERVVIGTFSTGIPI